MPLQPHDTAVMSFVTTKDGTSIFYKGWGTGRSVVYSHGWPLNGDAGDPQAKLVADNGYRAIVHDRRGYLRRRPGRSDREARPARHHPRRSLAGGGEVTRWIVHGSDDQIVPIVAVGEKSSKIVEDAQFTV
jgi:hypothetical protein